MHLTNMRLPRVDPNYRFMSASKAKKVNSNSHDPVMVGERLHKHAKYINSKSYDCTHKRCFACTKLDCPCDCHNKIHDHKQ